MYMYKNKCQRCNTETNITTMSIFNIENICMSCKELEKSHPLYSVAKQRELEEVKKGNLNYEGIGKPSDL